MANKPTVYGVNEIFHSIQGEGRWQGSPATFIRLQGCNVGCPWCDSKRTWTKGDKMLGAFTAVELVEQFKNENRHIVITGGEPTLYNLEELVLQLRATIPSAYIQLETSGQNRLNGFTMFDWITWSPKRELSFMAAEDVELLANEIKFVVDANLKPGEVQKVLSRCTATNPQSVAFMPEGEPPKSNAVIRAKHFATIFQDHFAPDSIGVIYADRLQYRLGVR